MNSIPLKISISDYGTRRLNISRDISYVQLLQQVQQLYGIQNDLNWTYVDEENDQITFNTEQEWRDAVQFWPNDKLLKLFATPVPIKPREEPIQQQPAANNTGSCPFSRMAACANSADRCCASWPVRTFLPLVLFYFIFTNPILTFIGLASAFYISYHHAPATFTKMSTHARNHWRKVAFVYALRMLLSCRICTLFVLIPLGIFVYRRVKRCHANSNGPCCYVQIRDRIMNFLSAHHITKCEDICKFACALAQGKQCPARAAPVARQEAPVDCASVQPSAPLVTELYPQVPEDLSDAPLPSAQPAQPFASELEALSMMGFDNKKLNEHLLRNFNGNLDRVISSLLQLSSMK